jgi:hypothetical protein
VNRYVPSGLGQTPRREDFAAVRREDREQRGADEHRYAEVMEPGPALLSGVRRFVHWFAHLLDDREPSRYSSSLIPGEDGKDAVSISSHEGGGAH